MDEFIPPRIEVVPTIKGFWCKCLMIGLYLALTLTPLVVGIWVGYEHNIWIGIAFFLFLTLVAGIVTSKMRVHSIPYEQREMNYSTLAIIKWFIAKQYCTLETF